MNLKCQLEAVIVGADLKGIEKQVVPYGADVCASYR